MWAENLQKGVLYRDIVGQRADPDLTSTWPTLARPHGSEEVRVWGQASSGKGRPRQVRGQRKHAVTWPDPTFEDTTTECATRPRVRKLSITVYSQSTYIPVYILYSIAGQYRISKLRDRRNRVNSHHQSQPSPTPPSAPLPLLLHPSPRHDLLTCLD